MSGYLSYAWSRYLQQLQRNPLPTKAITTAVVSAASELTAQQMLRRPDVNYKRLIGMSIWGLAYLGPYMHYYHTYMDRLFKGKRDLWTVIRKVLLDQLTSGPLNNFLYMVFSNLILEGRAVSVVKSTVEGNFRAVQTRSWMVWSVVSFVNNMFVPLQLRVLIGNITAFLWSVYLIRQATTKKMRPKPKEESKEL